MPDPFDLADWIIIRVARLRLLEAAERYAAQVDECRWEHDGPFHECALLEAAQRAYRQAKGGAA